jgi:hypothetical protein
MVPLISPVLMVMCIEKGDYVHCHGSFRDRFPTIAVARKPSFGHRTDPAGADLSE